MSPASPDRVSYEILRLLLQVAWADHAVQPAEREALLRLATLMGFGPEDRAQLASFLDGAKPLPAPNLGVLRDHRDEALAAARVLACADIRVLPDEKAIVKMIDDLLA